MQLPRALLTVVMVFTLFVGVQLVCADSLTTARAQKHEANSSDRGRGIELYENGDTDAAVKLLQSAVKQNKNDLVAWHYLGLAFERQGKTTDALNAHERAAISGDDLIEARFLKANTKQPALFLDEDREPLSFAVRSAQKYISLNAKLAGSNGEEWRRRLESLRYFAELSDTKNATSGQNKIFSDKEVSTKAHVVSKREPAYTGEALKNQVTGTIVLRAVFGADGKVWAIRPLRRLPFGLTDSAVKVAKQIRFVPATLDGRPVSTFQSIEYSFNLSPR